MAKKKCELCGLEADEHWMMSFNPGTGLKWLCWDCYKQGQYEVAKSEMSRRKKINRMAESKKRHK